MPRFFVSSQPGGPSVEVRRDGTLDRQSADGRHTASIIGTAIGTGDAAAAALPESLAREVRPLDVKGMSGSFAALVSGAPGGAQVITSSCGCVPVFVQRTSGGCLLATDPDDLLPADPPRVDSLALSSYLQLGYISGTRTFREDVALIPPDSIATLTNGRITITACTRTEFRRAAHASLADQVRQVAAALAEAVDAIRHQRGDVTLLLDESRSARALLAAGATGGQVAAVACGAAATRLATRVGARVLTLPEDGVATEARARRVGLIGEAEGLLGGTALKALARNATTLLDPAAIPELLGAAAVSEAWLHQQTAAPAALAAWQDLTRGVDPRALSASPLLPDGVHTSARDDFCARFRDTPGAGPADQAAAFLLADRATRAAAIRGLWYGPDVALVAPASSPVLRGLATTVPHAVRRADRFLERVIRHLAPEAAGAHGWLRRLLGRPMRLSSTDHALLGEEQTLAQGVLPADVVLRLRSDSRSVVLAGRLAAAERCLRACGVGR